MSKTLYLLRHADSPGRFDLSDHERPLSERGISQARKVGEHLSSLPPVNLALCSSAARTQETLEGLSSGGAKIKKSEILGALYNAATGDLLHEIQQQEDEINHLMLIAHNPGIHQLAHILLTPNSTQRLGFSYPPATLSIIRCECNKWQDIKLEQNQLIDIIHQN
ncbi:MAG: histidine phosphatase family protein [Alphaproteobacteria bacterium]|nr:histidine phosphatase family protein [Alphaproteobacteria bacterium]